MKKKGIVAVYIEDEERDQLRRIAKEEARSVSSLIAKVLKDFLKKRKNDLAGSEK